MCRQCASLGRGIGWRGRRETPRKAATQRLDRVALALTRLRDLRRHWQRHWRAYGQRRARVLAAVDAVDDERVVLDEVRLDHWLELYVKCLCRLPGGGPGAAAATQRWAQQLLKALEADVVMLEAWRPRTAIVQRAWQRACLRMGHTAWAWARETALSAPGNAPGGARAGTAPGRHWCECYLRALDGDLVDGRAFFALACGMHEAGAIDFCTRCMRAALLSRACLCEAHPVAEARKRLAGLTRQCGHLQTLLLESERYPRGEADTIQAGTWRAWMEPELWPVSQDMSASMSQFVYSPAFHILALVLFAHHDAGRAAPLWEALRLGCERRLLAVASLLADYVQSQPALQACVPLEALPALTEMLQEVIEPRGSDPTSSPLASGHSGRLQPAVLAAVDAYCDAIALESGGLDSSVGRRPPLPEERAFRGYVPLSTVFRDSVDWDSPPTELYRIVGDRLKHQPDVTHNQTVALALRYRKLEQLMQRMRLRRRRLGKKARSATGSYAA